MQTFGVILIRHRPGILTSDMAGDGTTTATVLARAIYREGQKLVAAGNNPMAIKRGIDKGVAKVVEELKKLSKPTRDKTEKEKETGNAGDG